MIRNTAFALAFVNAAANDINNAGGNMKKATWMSRRVAERVTNSRTGTVREDDVAVHVSYKTRQRIQRQQGVSV